MLHVSPYHDEYGPSTSSSSARQQPGGPRAASVTVYNNGDDGDHLPSTTTSASARKRASHAPTGSTYPLDDDEPPPTPTYRDVYSHPSAVAYAAAHPRRTIPKFGPYLLLQTIGEGEFGKVKLGLHCQYGEEVAVKLIRRGTVENPAKIGKIEREIESLKGLRHSNIVRLYDVIETDKYIGIILEYASGGELFDHILAHRCLKEKDACKLFAQLISGVWYMHAKKIVHRDLKLENLLLDRNRNVIISDFGFANHFEHKSDQLMQTSCGSPCYAAPELVISDGLYVGSAVDIWSCGVILYAMLAGYLPYDDDPANPEGDNINLLYKYIINTKLTFPDYISEEARDLLSKILVPDPNKRATLQTIIEHPWLSPCRYYFERSIDDLERLAVEQQEQKRIEYQRKMRLRAEAESRQKMTRSQSGVGSASSPRPRGLASSVTSPDVSYDMDASSYAYSGRAELPLPPTAGVSARRQAHHSAIVMPSHPYDGHEAYPSPDEADIRTPTRATYDSPSRSVVLGDDVQVQGDSRGEPRPRKESGKSRSSRKSAKEREKEKEREREKQKKKAARHTIQVEYDDPGSQSPGSPGRKRVPALPPSPPPPARDDRMPMDIDPPPPDSPKHANGVMTPVYVPSTPTDVNMHVGTPPKDHTPIHHRVSSNGSNKPLPTPPPAVPAHDLSSPVSPISPAGAQQKKRVGSTPPVTYLKHSSSIPAFDAATQIQGQGKVQPASQENVAANGTPPEPSAPTTPQLVDSGSASHRSSSTRSSKSKHRSALSIDRLGLGKLLGNTPASTAGPEGISTNGHPEPTEILHSPQTPITPATIHSSKPASKEKERHGRSLFGRASRNPSSTSVALSPADDASERSKKQKRRNTLSLMVEPIGSVVGRSLRDRSKVRPSDGTATKDKDKSRKTASMAVVPPTPVLPAHAVKSTTQVAPKGVQPPSRPDAQPGLANPNDLHKERVNEFGTSANLASTSKAKKVMDWFRSKSLNKTRSVSESGAYLSGSEDVANPASYVQSDTDAGRTTPTAATFRHKQEVTTPSDFAPQIIVNTPSSPSGSAQTPTTASHVPVFSRLANNFANTILPPSRSVSSRQSVQGSPSGPSNAYALRIHHGAVDKATVTTGNPPDVFAHVTKVLEEMGIELTKETEFKYRCIRPKRRKSSQIIGGGSSAGAGLPTREPIGMTSGALNAYTMVGSAGSNGVDKRGLPLPPASSSPFSSPSGMFRGFISRRQSSQTTPSGLHFGTSMASSESDAAETSLGIIPPPSSHSNSSLNHSVVAEPMQLPSVTDKHLTLGHKDPLYGDRTNDQADEVKFSVELTQVDRLADTYSLEIRRLKGNLRSYKFLYDTLRERCNFSR